MTDIEILRAIKLQHPNGIEKITSFCLVSSSDDGGVRSLLHNCSTERLALFMAVVNMEIQKRLMQAVDLKKEDRSGHQ